MEKSGGSQNDQQEVNHSAGIPPNSSDGLNVTTVWKIKVSWNMKWEDGDTAQLLKPDQPWFNIENSHLSDYSLHQ